MKLRLRGVGAGDLNSDGLLDIIVGNEGRNFVYLNQGHSTFSDKAIPFGAEDIRTSWVAVGDLNEDGLLDIVTNGHAVRQTILLAGPERNAIYLNQGNALFPEDSINLVLSDLLRGSGSISFLLSRFQP